MWRRLDIWDACACSCLDTVFTDVFVCTSFYWVGSSLVFAFFSRFIQALFKIFQPLLFEREACVQSSLYSVLQVRVAWRKITSFQVFELGRSFSTHLRCRYWENTSWRKKNNRTQSAFNYEKLLHTLLIGWTWTETWWPVPKKLGYLQKEFTWLIRPSASASVLPRYIGWYWLVSALKYMS